MKYTLILACALALTGCYPPFAPPQPPEPPRYTVSSTADQFLVLDQTTGDAWISAGMYWFRTNLHGITPPHRNTP